MTKDKCDYFYMKSNFEINKNASRKSKTLKLGVINFELGLVLKYNQASNLSTISQFATFDIQILPSTTLISDTTKGTASSCTRGNSGCILRKIS